MVIDPLHHGGVMVIALCPQRSGSLRFSLKRVKIVHIVQISQEIGTALVYFELVLLEYSGVVVQIPQTG